MNKHRKYFLLFIIMIISITFSACASKKVAITNNIQIPEKEYQEYFQSESNEKHNIIFENGLFGATIKTPNTYYIGRLKDNKAHGLGTSLYVYTYKNLMGSNVYACELLQGKFVEGNFVEGNQYLFDVLETDPLNIKAKTYKESPLLGDVDTFIKENMVNYNLTAEGVFIVKKFDKNPGGQSDEYWKYDLNGQGVLYDGNLIARNNGDTNAKAIKLYEGEFQDGDIVKGKQYLGISDNPLIYDGEFKNGKYEGNGKIYDTITGKLKYEGDFQNGDIKR